MALFPTSGTSSSMFPGGTGSGGASGTRTGASGTGVAGAGGLAGKAAGGPIFPPLAGGPTFPPLAGATQRPLLSGGLPTANLGGKIQVSNEEFLQLRDFIYAQSGIFIAEARKYLVENRLNNRIKALNLKNFGEYYYYLRFDPTRREELTKLFEVITTNETSFWRNPPQLQIFQDKVLTGELDKLRRSGHKKLRIWSAGCSTGEEPYTLAIILHEVLKNELSTWDIKITANDLSEAVLAAARKGVYSTYALRTTPRDIVTRYFIAEGGNYRIDPRMKRLISFGAINLSDKMMLKRVERSNIIFCRNVIIYFDEEMKRQVIESFYDNLLPGGCMLIGHSESLHNISRAFKPEYHAGTIVYRKEG
jgi:chemotaxis protein methyltransferase CheR